MSLLGFYADAHLGEAPKQKADRGYRSAEAAQAAQTDVPLANNNFDS